MLKSRTEWPPGGWQFREPATGWRIKGYGFEQTVTAIINHRKANRQFTLPLDRDVVAAELDNFNCIRIGNDPHYCTNETSPFVPRLKARSRPSGVGVVAGAVKWLSNTTAGIKLWIDWFGEGKPAPKELAEQRAAICAACPMNNKKASIAEWFTGAAAKEIMAIFSALNDLNLFTSKDTELRVCQACDCPLKAKVWAPLPIIKKHLSKDRFDRLHADCWIRHEKME